MLLPDIREGEKTMKCEVITCQHCGNKIDVINYINTCNKCGLNHNCFGHIA